MHDRIELRLPKWPFITGDALLLGAAYLIYARSELPMSEGRMALAVFCMTIGAVLCVIPFLLEYRAFAKLAEADKLANTVAQLKKLEEVADLIRNATAQWQTVQDQADKTNGAAKGITERMAAEAKAFEEFMQRVNDNEKATLRLEVEKLRRGEGDWLQILVRMLDHIFALHQAGLRSHQPNLIEQLTQFQNACRDAARRVGLTPFVAGEDEPFDAQRHQPYEGNGKPPEGAVVEQTLATGYTYQGRLLRPALVRLRNGEPGAVPAVEAPAETVDASSKPVDRAESPASSQPADVRTGGAS